VYDFLGHYNVFEGWKDDDGKTHLLEYETIQNEPILPAVQPSVTGWQKQFPEVAGFLRRFLPALVPDASAPPPLQKKPKPQRHTKPIKLFARPHEIFIARTPDDHEYVRAKVIHINPAGPLVKIELERRNGHVLTAELSKEVVDMLGIAKQDQIYVRPKNTRVFEE
jgi:sulfate transport system ATP-binding protein